MKSKNSKWFPIALGLSVMTAITAGGSSHAADNNPGPLNARITPVPGPVGGTATLTIKVSKEFLKAEHDDQGIELFRCDRPLEQLEALGDFKGCNAFYSDLNGKPVDVNVPTEEIVLRLKDSNNAIDDNGSVILKSCQALLNTKENLPEAKAICQRSLARGRISPEEWHSALSIAVESPTKLSYFGVEKTKTFDRCFKKEGDSYTYLPEVVEYLKSRPSEYVPVFVSGNQLTNKDGYGRCEAKTPKRLEGETLVQRTEISNKNRGILLSPGRYKVTYKNESGDSATVDLNIDGSTKSMMMTY